MNSRIHNLVAFLLIKNQSVDNEQENSQPGSLFVRITNQFVDNKQENSQPGNRKLIKKNQSVDNEQQNSQPGRRKLIKRINLWTMNSRIHNLVTVS